MSLASRLTLILAAGALLASSTVAVATTPAAPLSATGCGTTPGAADACWLAGQVGCRTMPMACPEGSCPTLPPNNYYCGLVVLLLDQVLVRGTSGQPPASATASTLALDSADADPCDPTVSPACWLVQKYQCRYLDREMDCPAPYCPPGLPPNNYYCGVLNLVVDRLVGPSVAVELPDTVGLQADVLLLAVDVGPAPAQAACDDPGSPTCWLVARIQCHAIDRQCPPPYCPAGLPPENYYCALANLLVDLLLGPRLADGTASASASEGTPDSPGCDTACWLQRQLTCTQVRCPSDLCPPPLPPQNYYCTLLESIWFGFDGLGGVVAVPGGVGTGIAIVPICPEPLPPDNYYCGLVNLVLSRFFRWSDPALLPVQVATTPLAA